MNISIIRRAFSLTEIVIALLLIAVALSILLVSWKRSRQLAALTRNRAAAVLQAENLLEEIRAHRFGQPAPASWQAPHLPPLEIWVNEKRQSLSIRQELSYKTGAFVGKPAPDKSRDEVTIKLTWDNPSGELQVTVPVWPQ